MLPDVWNLRRQRCFNALAKALAASKARNGFRIVHFVVIGNHLHLIVEAADEQRLTAGLRGLAVWMARRLNAVMRRRGQVFADRYHAHQLRSLAEARNAIRYVVDNYDVHARRVGKIVPSAGPDQYSSAGRYGRDLVSAPTTWLLQRASK
jgi:putative transposase